MEHKKGKSLDHFLESLDSGDTMDAFLKRKQGVKQACQDTPLSEMKPTSRTADETLPSKSAKKAVVDAVADSSKQTSLSTDETEDLAKLQDVRDVGGNNRGGRGDGGRGDGGNDKKVVSSAPQDDDEEPRPLAEIPREFEEVIVVSEKPHPIVGYTSHIETIEYELTDEERSIYITTYQSYIADAEKSSPMEAITLARKYISEMERNIRKGKRAQQGATQAIEALLHKLNAGQRLEYEKLDAAERAQFLKKQASKKGKSKAVGSEKSNEKKKAATDYKKVKAAVNSQMALGFEKDQVVKNLEKSGLLDDLALAYINKMFSS